MNCAHRHGHHIDTRYAFNDRLMFPTRRPQRIDMYHPTRNASCQAGDGIPEQLVYKISCGRWLFYARLSIAKSSQAAQFTQAGYSC